jgi:hypothetical protein
MVSSMLLVNIQNIQATPVAEENTWQTLQSLPEPLSGVAVTVDEKIYIFSSSSLFVYNTQNQTLNETASMPTYRVGFGVAVVGHKIYTIGGQHFYPLPGGAVGGYPTNITEAYDAQTGTWETKQPAISATVETFANVVNGKIYAMTESFMDLYDPEADNWTRISALPQEVLGPHYSCAIDDKIYVRGVHNSFFIVSLLMVV